MWRDRDFGFGRLFEDMDREFAEAEEMLNRMFRTVRGMRPEELAANFPYYYGYQVTIGPDGRPHVREFGNIKPAARGLVAPSETREPLVDTALDEKENTLVITAEMPGVTKQDIKVEVSQDTVTIHAEKGDKKYHTEIPSSAALDDKSAKATYANGILELKIKLKEPPKPKATEVKVE
ncbi:archaeal heat shock protein Hsp20 [Nitrososphaera sp.]|uniref:archaeal heat shock protein Hsp20 n=1 Tax=Nitrososphaera sp. TaxID=1971748 RepID=UPI00307D1CAC